YLSTNHVQHQRTKHIEIDIHFVRNYVASGQVRVLHVPSRFQYADIFTKGLPSALFLNILGWRLSIDKLPTRVNLDARGIDVPSVLCPICGECTDEMLSTMLRLVLGTSVKYGAKTVFGGNVLVESGESSILTPCKKAEDSLEATSLPLGKDKFVYISPPAYLMKDMIE
ncbi:NBS-containing resistance-like protein, partial [Tanacetum coccineum]